MQQQSLSLSLSLRQGKKEKKESIDVRKTKVLSLLLPFLLLLFRRRRLRLLLCIKASFPLPPSRRPLKALLLWEEGRRALIYITRPIPTGRRGRRGEGEGTTKLSVRKLSPCLLYTAVAILPPPLSPPPPSPFTIGCSGRRGGGGNGTFPRADEGRERGGGPAERGGFGVAPRQRKTERR